MLFCYILHILLVLVLILLSWSVYVDNLQFYLPLCEVVTPHDFCTKKKIVNKELKLSFPNNKKITGNTDPPPKISCYDPSPHGSNQTDPVHVLRPFSPQCGSPCRSGLRLASPSPLCWPIPGSQARSSRLSRLCSVGLYTGGP